MSGADRDLNSPYEYPSRHRELDDSGQPTNRILDHRRRFVFHFLQRKEAQQQA